MDKNTKKSKRRKKQNIQDFEIENFSFIVGYTSGGFPYGNPWEESDDKNNERKTYLSKVRCNL